MVLLFSFFGSSCTHAHTHSHTHAQTAHTQKPSRIRYRNNWWLSCYSSQLLLLWLLLLYLFWCEQLFALSMSQWGRVRGEGVLTATSTASAAAAPAAAVLSIRTVDADVGCGFFIFLLCSALVYFWFVALRFLFFIRSSFFRVIFVRCVDRSLALVRTHRHTYTMDECVCKHRY